MPIAFISFNNLKKRKVDGNLREYIFRGIGSQSGQRPFHLPKPKRRRETLASIYLENGSEAWEEMEEKGKQWKIGENDKETRGLAKSMAEEVGLTMPPLEP